MNDKHRSNRRIGKIGCYHIALYRLSSRVGDKQTRTADIRLRETIIRRPVKAICTSCFVIRLGLKFIF
ncbi:hypothetical protein Hdeb2414_s0001g00027551 [Helianthus debilis subsp. tardiflorus]